MCFREKTWRPGQALWVIITRHVSRVMRCKTFNCYGNIFRKKILFFSQSVTVWPSKPGKESYLNRWILPGEIVIVHCAWEQLQTKIHQWKKLLLKKKSGWKLKFSRHKDVLSNVDLLIGKTVADQRPYGDKSIPSFDLLPFGVFPRIERDGNLKNSEVAL